MNIIHDLNVNYDTFIIYQMIKINTNAKKTNVKDLLIFLTGTHNYIYSDK